MKRKIICTLAVIVSTLILVTTYVSASESLPVKETRTSTDVLRNTNNNIVAENNTVGQNNVNEDEGVMPISIDEPQNAVNNNANEIQPRTSSGIEIIDKNEIDSISGRTITSDDLYGAEEKTKKYSDSIVNGNVFIANQETVEYIDSEINGNVFIMAKSVYFDNVTISGSLFVLAQDIEIKDTEVQAIYACGKEVSIDKYSTVTYDVRVAGETVTIEGRIKRNLYVASSTIIINENAVIGNNADVTASTIQIEESSILGELKTEIVEPKNEESQNSIIKYVIIKAIELVVIIILSIIFVNGALPKFSNVNRKLKLSKFVKSFFIGLLSIILFILASAVLCICQASVYGVALMLIFVALLLCGPFMFIVSAALRISGKFDKQNIAKDLTMVALATILLDVIEALAMYNSVGIIIATIVYMIVGLAGFGAAVEIIFMSKKKMNKIIEGENEEVQETIVNEEIDEEQKESVSEANTEQEEATREIIEEPKAVIKETITEEKIIVETEPKEAKAESEETVKEDTKASKEVKASAEEKNETKSKTSKKKPTQK